MNTRAILLCLTALYTSFTTVTSGKRIKIDPGTPKIETSVYDVNDEEIQGSIRIVNSGNDFSSPVFSGYDKTLGADVETFFLTNRSARLLTGYSVDIIYLSEDNSQLHRRHVFRRCNIAPGETQRVDIRSWDRQHSFVYYKSTKPRREAIPYKIKIEPAAYFIRKN